MTQSNQKLKKQIENNILDILYNKTLAPSDIQNIYKNQYKEISRTHLIRKLNDLIKNGYVLPVGEGRNRSYKTTEKTKSLKWFDTPYQMRPDISFKRYLLDEYIPNKTNWLTLEQKEKMNRVQPNIDQPANTYARKISKKLMIELSYSSSKLEGNTYSLAETKELLLNGNVSNKRSTEESVMILNHKKAIEYILNLIDPDDSKIIDFNGNIDSRLIRDIHYLLSDGLVYANQRGGIRHNIVEIGGSSYKPESSPHILTEYLELICEKSNLINNPFENSLFLMTTIPYLQPFVDVNKRTGRLCSNIPLLNSGLAPLSFNTMNKEDYTQGLLQFYELGNTDFISEAYFDAYTSSAHIYKASLGKTDDEIKVNLLYRKDLRKTMIMIANYYKENKDDNLNLVHFIPKNILEEHKILYKRTLEDNILNITEHGAKLDGFSSDVITSLLEVKNTLLKKENRHTTKLRKYF